MQEEDLSTLQFLLDQQKKLDDSIRDERDLGWEDPQDELSELCTAMSNEVEELRDETSWKWWSDDTPMNYDKAIEELIDILHFWLSTANLLGLDAESIKEEYSDKNQTNFNRQEEGY